MQSGNGGMPRRLFIAGGIAMAGRRRARRAGVLELSPGGSNARGGSAASLRPAAARAVEGASTAIVSDRACLAPDPALHPPGFRVPAGAWDTHVHAIGPIERFPLAPHRSYTPAQVPIEAYVALMDRLGFAHAVLVQPSIYGSDNGAMLDALTRHRARFRGVAVVDPGIDDRALHALGAAGVRGVRANLLNPGGLSWAGARALAGRLAALGWHLQLQIDASAFDGFDALEALPVDVVIDHMGYLPAERGVSNPGFRRLLALVESGHCWVKLSAAYRLVDWQRHGYAAVAPLARALVRANPQRVLWGSDWPHTDLRSAMPNDADLLDLLGAWVDDDAIRDAILVGNPAALYGARF
jgi:predicted TIM-barrel fold metal-dependent hydrolase